MTASSWPLLFCTVLLHFCTRQEVVSGATYGIDTLELVQIAYRHGDRAPTDPFPNDVNNAYWTDGIGQLTNIGKQQHFGLGGYIRQRYTGYFNTTYNREEILINSTDKDRTLMSAYSNLAGLFPPDGVQVWNDNLPWQPIPVHTRPEPIDYLVDPDSYCPTYYDLFNAVQQSPELQAINAQYANLYEYLTNMTGFYVHDVFSVNKVHDALFCDMCHNLTIPSWVDAVWSDMDYLHNLKFLYEYGVPQLSYLRGGPLLGHVIDNMHRKINGFIDKQKFFVYSTHDSMLTALLSAMSIWNGVQPPYFSAVFVELHKLEDGNHGVQISYRNDTTVDPYVLTIPNCTSPCPIDQFVELTKSQVPEDILADCGISQPLASWMDAWL